MPAVRIKNERSRGLILQIRAPLSVASATLSRGRVIETPLHLRPHEQIDAAIRLGVSGADALRLVRASPDVTRRVAAGDISLTVVDEHAPSDVVTRSEASKVTEPITDQVLTPSPEAEPEPFMPKSQRDPLSVLLDTQPVDATSIDAILPDLPKTVDPHAALRTTLRQLTKEQLIAHAAGLTPPLQLSDAQTKAAMIDAIVGRETKTS